MTDLSLLSLANLSVLIVLGLLLSPSAAAKLARQRLEGVKQRHRQGKMIEREVRSIIDARATQQPSGLTRFLPNPELIGLRLHRAGLRISLNFYAALTAGLVIGFVLLFLAAGAPLHIALLSAFPMGLLIPHLIVSQLIKRRVNQFVIRFPDAIELMVRGLRSSLPIAQSVDVVGQDFSGPIGEEFRLISDKVKIGLSLDQSLTVAAQRINLPEFQFFCISLAIQRETGGNMAETLSNLAEVLRKRMQMKLKIKALTSEAKASAMIIGALPFIVFLTVYLSSPSYLEGFVTDPRLTIAGIGALIWMGIGGFVMAKMSSFEI